MASSSSVITLPRIAIQHDLPTVQQEIRQGLHAAEDCWCSCLLADSPSVHGKLRLVEGDQEGTVDIEGRDGVQGTSLDNTTLRISCDKLSFPPTPVRFPSLQPASLRGGVLAFDVSPDGLKVVVGGQGGSLRVKSTSSSKEVVCKGHVGDVTVAKFFPSSEVLMTGSMDMSIRIWSALDGSNPRTLCSHTKPLTSLIPLGRGRQILSSSLDGSIKLWTVASGTVDRTWRLSQPISGILLLPVAAEDEEQIEGRTALVGHTNGTASLIALTTTSADTPIVHPLLQLNALSPSPIDSLALHDSSVVALGGRNGVISVFQLPPTLPPPSGDGAESMPPLLQWRRSEVAVNSLVFSAAPASAPTATTTALSLLVAPADGLPYIASLSLPPPLSADLPSTEATVSVQEELAGLDTDAATGILEVASEAAGKSSVWLASKDGQVRCYRRGGGRP